MGRDAAAQARRTEEFRSLCHRIAGLIVEYTNDQLRRAGCETPSEGFRRAREMISAAIQEFRETTSAEVAAAPVDLPDDTKRLVSETLDDIDRMKAGSPMPPNPAPQFNPVVLWLLQRNFILAAEEVGRDAAAKQIKAWVRQLTKKRKGRPPAAPPALALQAKALRDQGLSDGAIARRLHRTSQWVRTTLKQKYQTAKRPPKRKNK